MAKIHQIFALFFFFEKLKTSKSNSEINWPLAKKIQESFAKIIKLESLQVHCADVSMEGAKVYKFPVGTSVIFALEVKSVVHVGR